MLVALFAVCLCSPEAPTSIPELVAPKHQPLLNPTTVRVWPAWPHRARAWQWRTSALCSCGRPAHGARHELLPLRHEAPEQDASCNVVSCPQALLADLTASGARLAPEDLRSLQLLVAGARRPLVASAAPAQPPLPAPRKGGRRVEPDQAPEPELSARKGRRRVEQDTADYDTPSPVAEPRRPHRKGGKQAEEAVAQEEPEAFWQHKKGGVRAEERDEEPEAGRPHRKGGRREDGEDKPEEAEAPRPQRRGGRRAEEPDVDEAATRASAEARRPHRKGGRKAEQGEEAEEEEAQRAHRKGKGRAEEVDAGGEAEARQPRRKGKGRADDVYGAEEAEAEAGGAVLQVRVLQAEAAFRPCNCMCPHADSMYSIKHAPVPLHLLHNTCTWRAHSVVGTFTACYYGTSAHGVHTAWLARPQHATPLVEQPVARSRSLGRRR